MTVDARGRIVAHYVFQPTKEEPEDWGEIVVYLKDGHETYQVQQKGKDVGRLHSTYKEARAALKGAA